jgi:ketosteroid isomerase-like protein
MTLQVANLDTAAEKHSFDHGQLDIITLGNAVIGRAVFNPGWRWSVDAKPLAGTESCRIAHAGVVLSGRFHVRMDDGSEADLGPGDAHMVAPGHDAWVVGDEQCVIIDIGPAPDAGPAPEDVVRSYFQAFNDARVDDILALYTEDATVMAENTPTASGHAQLRATYEGFFAAFAVEEDVVIERVATGTDIAVVRTRSSGSMTVKADGESTPLALRELFALRRTPAGWQIADYVFNSAPKTQ